MSMNRGQRWQVYKEAGVQHVMAAPEDREMDVYLRR